jgi:hypothetical protein
MRKTRSIDKTPFLAPDVETKIVPAPTDGWDAISPLAEMDPKRAPILINWVPRPGLVELRGGYIPYNSTLGTNAVETLMVWRGPSSEKMFAASGTHIFDVTNPGIATAAVLSDSGGGPPTFALTTGNARFQYANFTPAGSVTVIQCCNGNDGLLMFDGTNWKQANNVNTPSFTITGLPGGFTAASIINIATSKRRLWYVLANSTVAAFMPTDAITGPIAGTQDLGALWTMGGHLVATASWTIDGGAGPQDYTMFISSRGQVSVYAGTDPTNSASWSLVGTFAVSPPISNRCLLRVGSDVAIITLQGVIPISQALPFDPSADRSIAITARIQNAMAAAAMNGQLLFGWQLISFPAQQLAILNVPLIENSSQQQYVMDVLTGAWCQFIGWNANCFEIYNDKLYWGGNAGQINQGFIGGSDSVSSIPADMQCAFNWFDEPGKTKRMTMVQPLLTIAGPITPTISVDTDFTTSTATAPISNLQSTTLWDLAKWDVDSWPSGSIGFSNWLTVTAVGHAMAIRMRVNVSTNVLLTLGLFDSATFDNGLFDGGLSPQLPVLQLNAFNAILETGGAI